MSPIQGHQDPNYCMEKAVNNYLRELLLSMEASLIKKGAAPNETTNLIDFILGKLQRKTFRRKITSKQKLILREKVARYISNHEPLRFVIPFGGYKHFWNQSYPEPDWAELFNFRFLTEYVAPILMHYEPGVIIEYISEDLILPWMNNYPETDLDAYWQTFQKLLDWYQNKVPANLKFVGSRISDHHDKQAIFADIKKVLPERLAAFQKLSVDDRERELHRSLRNVMWRGQEDLTKLSVRGKTDRLVQSRVVELAYYETESKPEFLGSYLADHIMLLFSFGLSQDNLFEDLTLKSNSGSTVDFWIGRGILEYRDGRFRPTTVSRTQYEKIQSRLTSVNSPLLSFKNFQTIDIDAGPS